MTWSVQTENVLFRVAWSPGGESILVCEGNLARLYRSIPWPELAQLGDEDTFLDERVRLWDKRQRN